MALARRGHPALFLGVVCAGRATPGRRALRFALALVGFILLGGHLDFLRFVGPGRRGKSYAEESGS